MRKVALLLGLLFLMFTHLSLAMEEEEDRDRKIKEYYSRCGFWEGIVKRHPEFASDETLYSAAGGYYITAYKKCRQNNGTVEECIKK